MSPHKKTYLEFHGKHEGDFIPCAICQQAAVDVHAIQREGMGGDEGMNRIDNLIALCRKHHETLGDRVAYKAMMYKIIFYELMRKNFEEFDWIIKQIIKYESIF